MESVGRMTRSRARAAAATGTTPAPDTNNAKGAGTTGTRSRKTATDSTRGPVAALFKESRLTQDDVDQDTSAATPAAKSNVKRAEPTSPADIDAEASPQAAAEPRQLELTASAVSQDDQGTELTPESSGIAETGPGFAFVPVEEEEEQAAPVISVLEPATPAALSPLTEINSAAGSPPTLTEETISTEVPFSFAAQSEASGLESPALASVAAATFTQTPSTPNMMSPSPLINFTPALAGVIPDVSSSYGTTDQATSIPPGSADEQGRSVMTPQSTLTFAPDVNTVSVNTPQLHISPTPDAVMFEQNTSELSGDAEAKAPNSPTPGSPCGAVDYKGFLTPAAAKAPPAAIAKAPLSAMAAHVSSGSEGSSAPGVATLLEAALAATPCTPALAAASTLASDMAPSVAAATQMVMALDLAAAGNTAMLTPEIERPGSVQAQALHDRAAFAGDTPHPVSGRTLGAISQPVQAAAAPFTAPAASKRVSISTPHTSKPIATSTAAKVIVRTPHPKSGRTPASAQPASAEERNSSCTPTASVPIFNSDARDMINQHDSHVLSAGEAVSIPASPLVEDDASDLADDDNSMQVDELEGHYNSMNLAQATAGPSYATTPEAEPDAAEQQQTQIIKDTTKATSPAQASRSPLTECKAAARTTPAAAAHVRAEQPAKTTPAASATMPRYLLNTASSAQKARPLSGGGAAEASAAPTVATYDPVKWAPAAKPAVQAVAADVPARLKSKVVIPETSTYDPRSLASYRREIREKAKPKQAAVSEAMPAIEQPSSMTEVRHNKLITKAVPDAASPTVMPDEDDGEEEAAYNEAAEQELVAAMEGGKMDVAVTSSAPIALRGVPVPQGRHTRFTDEGKAVDSPSRIALRGVAAPTGSHKRWV